MCKVKAVWAILLFKKLFSYQYRMLQLLLLVYPTFILELFSRDLLELLLYKEMVLPNTLPLLE